LLVIFFGAGALICFVTMLALAFPGGLLESIWRLKPEVRVEFQELGRWSIALMAVVGAACGLAAIGLAKNAEWGRRLAIVILTLNLIGDSLNAFLRHDPPHSHRPADWRINDLVFGAERSRRKRCGYSGRLKFKPYSRSLKEPRVIMVVG
jgi:hypothetical protein